MSQTFRHEPDAQRFALYTDGELSAIVDYTINGTAISLTRVYTTPAQRGLGVAAQIMKLAVDEIENTTALRIVAMCAYAGEWFEKNPHRAALLTR